MNKKIYIVTLIIIVCVNLIGCNQTVYRIDKTNMKFILPQLNSGDAKLVGDYIITSINGNMEIVDTKSQEIHDLGIKSNWIDCFIDNDKIIVAYSNNNFETGICILDSKGNKLKNNIIFSSESLNIDPCIIKNKDLYYLTTTKISGIINNADINSENGEYTVQLFTSNNLDKWVHSSDIIDYKSNIEDVELDIYNNRMYLIFEKEIVDKGPSSIGIVVSEDYGHTWGEEKQLLASDSDHELAKLIKKDDKWSVYYSSDKDDIGSSYTGAKVYESIYDEKFNMISKDNPINISNPKGTLLYDVQVEENNLELLYSKDYLNENSLVLEAINVS